MLTNVNVLQGPPMLDCSICTFVSHSHIFASSSTKRNTHHMNIFFAYTGRISTPQVMWNKATKAWDEFSLEAITTDHACQEADRDEAMVADSTNSYMERTAHWLSHS